jgi:hypothetical protein
LQQQLEAAKDRKETLDQGQATKKLEKQVKDLKAKLMVAENLVLKRA